MNLRRYYSFFYLMIFVSTKSAKFATDNETQLKKTYPYATTPYLIFPLFALVFSLWQRTKKTCICDYHRRAVEHRRTGE